VSTAAGVRSRNGAAVTFGLTLEANARRLSPYQRSALVNLALGALPWINRAFGRRGASPSTWVTFTTARALAREGLATISVSGSGSWLRLTARGRTYARVLAEGPRDEAAHRRLMIQSEHATSHVELSPRRANNRLVPTAADFVCKRQFTANPAALDRKAAW
jgi:hypothetical protein